jgi:hypothetical protein
MYKKTINLIPNKMIIDLSWITQITIVNKNKKTTQKGIILVVYHRRNKFRLEIILNQNIEIYQI